VWYKVLTRDLRSTHGGDFDWSEYVGRPKKRAPRVRDVVICRRGYHATTDPMQWPVIGMRVFEAIVRGKPVAMRDGKGVWSVGGDKGVWPTMGLGAERPELVPDWWHDVEDFVAELPELPRLRPRGEPDSSWRVFDTWRVARDAARDAARNVAMDVARHTAWVAAEVAARDAGREEAQGIAQAVTLGEDLGRVGRAARRARWDAALWVSILVCKGLPLKQKYIDDAKRRMEVWWRGYGLCCDIDGVLYVYRRLGDRGSARE